ncbi:aspartyl/asparaginyl beta-hydroxylase domain-containing protein [Mycolicibacterium vaccae]|nr:aspartyl/asparaginyl beta-hydroxylase domain-containing protein [Mycolicibacterium vaccae]
MSEKRRSIVLGRIAAWAYAMFDRLQALFGRLLSHAPSGRTEFFDPSDFPWIAEVEARADEIQAELDGLLAEVDKLPNFQDIQEEQRHLTQDDRWKVFAFYAYGGRAESNCNRCPRTPRSWIDSRHDHGAVLGVAPAQAHPAAHWAVEGGVALPPRSPHPGTMRP